MAINIKTTLLLIATFICGSLQAQQDIPDAKQFLPGPPGETSVEYLKDFAQYAWGKSQRSTLNGQQAAGDMNYQLSTYLDAFSPLVGLTISKSNTPNIYLVADYIMTYGQNTIEAAKNAFPFSLRPYAKFKENSLVADYEQTYANISTYPSAYAFMGWLMALTLIEICPDKQDPILARGYSFGTSSVIAGYNWDSDAISGRLLACAMTAQLHNHANFNSMIKSARQEYEQKTGISNTIITTDPNAAFFPIDYIPDAAKYLPDPPAMGTVAFAYDVNQHIVNSKKRSTSEGQSAIEDIELSIERMCTIYSPAFGKTISQTATPHIYQLIDRTFLTGKPAYSLAKAKYVRLRPFYQLNEHTAYIPGEDQANFEQFVSTSYPSGHSSQAWLTAMVLAEINSSSAEAVLARAYQYGQSRVITGYHWQSDVESGRLLASAIYAHLHASDEFMKMMDLAKKEYQLTSYQK